MPNGVLLQRSTLIIGPSHLLLRYFPLFFRKLFFYTIKFFYEASLFFFILYKIKCKIFEANFAGKKIKTSFLVKSR